MFIGVCGAVASAAGPFLIEPQTPSFACMDYNLSSLVIPLLQACDIHLFYLEIEVGTECYCLKGEGSDALEADVGSLSLSFRLHYRG